MRTHSHSYTILCRTRIQIYDTEVSNNFRDQHYMLGIALERLNLETHLMNPVKNIYRFSSISRFTRAIFKFQKLRSL